MTARHASRFVGPSRACRVSCNVIAPRTRDASPSFVAARHPEGDRSDSPKAGLFPKDCLPVPLQRHIRALHSRLVR